MKKVFYLGKINEAVNSNDSEDISTYTQLNLLINEILSEKESFYDRDYNRDIVVNYEKKLIDEHMNFDDEFTNHLYGILGLDKDLNYSSYYYFGSRYSYTSVRWMVKYLSEKSDGNDYFRPARRLEYNVRKNLYGFLLNSVEVDTDDNKERLMNDVLSQFDDEIYVLIKRIIINTINSDWHEANDIRGKGSSEKKARKIQRFLRETLDSYRDEIVEHSISVLKSKINLVVNCG